MATSTLHMYSREGLWLSKVLIASPTRPVEGRCIGNHWHGSIGMPAAQAADLGGAVEFFEFLKICEKHGRYDTDTRDLSKQP